MAHALFVLVFVLVSLIPVAATAVYALRRGTGSAGFSTALIPGLVACIALFVVALAPTIVFLADGPHPEYHSLYYSAARWLVRIGLVSSLAFVVWRCFQIGPGWAALGVALWAALVVFTTGVAAYWLIAVQV